MLKLRNRSTGALHIINPLLIAFIHECVDFPEFTGGKNVYLSNGQLALSTNEKFEIPQAFFEAFVLFDPKQDIRAESLGLPIGAEKARYRCWINLAQIGWFVEAEQTKNIEGREYLHYALIIGDFSTSFYCECDPFADITDYF